MLHEYDPTVDDSDNSRTKNKNKTLKEEDGWFQNKRLKVEDKIWELSLVFQIWRKRTISLMGVYEKLRLVCAIG